MLLELWEDFGDYFFLLFLMMELFFPLFFFHLFLLIKLFFPLLGGAGVGKEKFGRKS